MLRTFRKVVLTGASLACLTVAAGAADLDPTPTYKSGSWYLRGDLGIAFSDADGQPNSEEAFAAGLGLGYRWNEIFRTDITFDGAFDYDFGNGVDSYGVLLNGYFDIPLGMAFTPYVGGGIGWGEVNGNGVKDDGLSLAGMAGVSFDVSSSLAIDVGYKLRYTDLSASQTGGVDYWIDHMVRAGVRFSF